MWIPKEILTDQGTNFMSTLMQEVDKLLNITHNIIRISPYHSQTDKRFNGTLKSMMKKFASKNQKDWDKCLPYLCLIRLLRSCTRINRVCTIWVAVLMTCARTTWSFKRIMDRRRSWSPNNFGGAITGTGKTRRDDQDCGDEYEEGSKKTEVSL